MRLIPIALLCLGLLPSACYRGKISESDRKAVEAEKKRRTFKRVNEAEVVAKAFEQGRAIATEAQAALAGALATSLANDGPAAALKYCNIQAQPIADSVSRAYSAKVKRVSLKTRNPGNQPDSTESVVLEAYDYNAQHGGKMDDNVQRIGDRYMLYTKPIMLQNPMCLQCHGTPGKDITLVQESAIGELYPDDKATGYRLGEFRGMWSIKLPRKALINDL